MIDEDRSYFDGRTMFDRVLMRGPRAGRTLACADIIERRNEVACIGGTFLTFSREYTADMDGMRVEAPLASGCLTRMSRPRYERRGR